MYHDKGFCKSMKKITPLQKGDSICIISPAGPIKDAECLFRAVDYIKSSGFNIVLGDNLFAQQDYLAGSDDIRLDDFHAAFKSDAKAILCARGGYGCTRLLDKIDYDLIAQNPKIFMGHSDITALLNNLPCPCFHSPMAIGDFGGEIDVITQKSFLEVIQGAQITYLYGAKPDFQTINKGVVSAPLLGGNLSVLVSLLGTKYFPACSDKILLIEDLNEEPYKIDRMLTQLRLGSVFDKVCGVVFAGFGKTEVSVEFLRSFLPLNLPSFYGFWAAHDKSKYTLPFNALYRLDATWGTLELIEDIWQ
jgi:muramoyltetrapeptide carboxypeptidase